MSPRATPEQRRRRRSTAGAVVVSLLVVGATGAVAGFGDDLWTAGALDLPAGEQVAVEARSNVAVCPAPVALADPGSTGDSEFGSTPVETVTSLQVVTFGAATTSVLAPLVGPGEGSGSEPTAAGETGERTVQGAEPSAVVVLDQGPQAEVVRSTTSGTGSDVTSSTSSLTTTGDLRGLAAASCAAPGVDQWLVGGGTELGSSTRLTLTNPSRTAATVTLALWGPSGPLDPAGPTTYLVPPGAEVSTLVEGLAAQQRGIVVHVTSAGALVTATLQHSVLDGLTPRGVDLVVPGAAPATAQVLSGVVVEASAIGDADVASVRLLAPEEEGTATLVVLGADGQRVLRGVQTTELAVGTVTDVSLAGLPAGSYSVVVQADVPVVAGAVTTSTGRADPDEPLIGTPVDRTWIASQEQQVQGPSTVALPDDADGTVTLVALPAGLDGSTDLASQVPILYDQGATGGDVAGRDAAGTDAAGDDAADPTPSATTSDDPTATPTDDASPSTDEAATWAAAEVGTLEVYGTDGSLVATQPVELAVGQTATVDLQDLVVEAVGRTRASDVVVGAARFVPDPQAPSVVAWSLTARSATVSGSITTLLPTAPPVAQDALVVRRSPTVGLPTS